MTQKTARQPFQVVAKKYVNLRGKIVERRSKRGEVFFGSDRSPDCTFVLWNRPVAEACPDCDRPYLVEKYSKKLGRRQVCDDENCEYSKNIDEQPAAAS